MLLEKCFITILSFNFLCISSFIKPYSFHNKRTILYINKPSQYNSSNHYLKLFSLFLKQEKKNILTNNSSNNDYNYDYLKNLNDNYKSRIENRILSNKNLIKKITFDDLLIFNNYIDAIYYDNNTLSDKIIVEFKNNTRKVYYYNENFNSIKEIFNNKKIDIINMNDYPYYLSNTPLAFLLCEER